MDMVWLTGDCDEHPHMLEVREGQSRQFLGDGMRYNVGNLVEVGKDLAREMGLPFRNHDGRLWRHDGLRWIELTLTK